MHGSRAQAAKCESGVLRGEDHLRRGVDTRDCRPRGGLRVFDVFCETPLSGLSSFRASRALTQQSNTYLFSTYTIRGIMNAARAGRSVAGLAIRRAGALKEFLMYIFPQKKRSAQRSFETIRTQQQQQQQPPSAASRDSGGGKAGNASVTIACLHAEAISRQCNPHSTAAAPQQNRPQFSSQ